MDSTTILVWGFTTKLGSYSVQDHPSDKRAYAEDELPRPHFVQGDYSVRHAISHAVRRQQRPFIVLPSFDFKGEFSSTTLPS